MYCNRVEYDLIEYNEEAPNRGALKVPMALV